MYAEPHCRKNGQGKGEVEEEDKEKERSLVSVMKTKLLVPGSGRARARVVSLPRKRAKEYGNVPLAQLLLRAMEHDKQAEKDYEEEEENGEDEDEQGTLFEEEEDSHFDVKALSVMLRKIALFGSQRSIFLLFKVQRRSCPKFKSNDAQFFLSHICSISTLCIEESLFFSSL
ncbi:unnamed protein product [Triticum turgidum subsp. durum]|uniref:Uncharacterized protein n=1 Tax=Triticum turgidum subsp. durum TaxID=4567 RepID=A0A9R0QR96_TRITD|nr:unnamed protein product [Triticum turgidum subsp. durum]